MLNKAFCFISCVLLSIAILSCRSQGQPGKPHLHIDNEVIQLGDLHKSTPVYHYTIPVKNDGGGELSISEVQTSCFCTTVDYPKSPISSGDKEEIKVDFSTENVSTQTGFMRVLTIISNATNDTVHVYLEGNILN